MNTLRWLTVMCLAASAPAYASSAFKPIELKDSEMSELRGRYVMPGRIVSFGLVMSSTWTNAAGATVTGTANMQVNASTVTPQFYVQITGNDGSGATQQPTGTGTVVGGTGLGTGQGVVQSVRAAGDGNTANNGVDINVDKSGLAPANYNQGNVVQQIGGGNVLQGTVIQGNSNFVNNLTQLNVVLGNNGLNNITQNLNLDQLKGLRPSGY